jgi:hypothetical protein
MMKEPSLSTTDIENLDLYYEDCVIGGPGAFIMTIKDREKFQAAIRTKLVREVAGLTPESGIVPAAEKEPRVPCLIGEKNRRSAAGGECRDDHSEPPGEQTLDSSLSWSQPHASGHWSC